MQVNIRGNLQFSFALLVAGLLQYVNQGMIASLPFWFHGKLNTEALQGSGCIWMKYGFKVGIVLRSFVCLQNCTQSPVPLNSSRNTQTVSFCQSLPPDSLAMCQRNICLFLPQFLYPLTFNCFPHSQPC